MITEVLAATMAFSGMSGLTATAAPPDGGVAAASGAGMDPVLVEDPAGVLALLLLVLATIFHLERYAVMQRFFRIVPSLVFCYFVPTLLTTLEVLPQDSVVYDWVKGVVLPASLLLLILALDLPGIVRLGPKALITMLAGTAGVVIGGPVALWISGWLLRGSWALPEDAWRGMTALAGSWIGGGANFVALGKVAGVSDDMMGLMVIPDVFVSKVWMGFLLFLSAYQWAVDRWTRADNTAIRDLQRRMSEFQEKVTRVPTLSDLLVILALGFVASWLSIEGGAWMERLLSGLAGVLDRTAWTFLLVTTAGVLLSFTPVRNLEGAGASRIGSLMMYLLVACIGATADFRMIVKAPGFMVAGFIWMAVHILVLLGVAWMIRAPLFFVAVGSQANIGGAASAPVVASAFHPSLAPVGALLAIAGYVLGTYAGLVCMKGLQWVAGAS